MPYIVGGLGSHTIRSARQSVIEAGGCGWRKEPMAKISFSGLDSGQYSNVEPPGIDRLSDTSLSSSGLCCSTGVPVTMEVKMPQRLTCDRGSIAHQTVSGFSHNVLKCLDQ